MKNVDIMDIKDENSITKVEKSISSIDLNQLNSDIKSV